MIYICRNVFGFFFYKMYYLKFSIFIYRERTRKRRGKSEVPFEMHKRNGCFSAHKNYGKTNIIKNKHVFLKKTIDSGSKKLV